MLQLNLYWLRAHALDMLGTFISQRKGKIQTRTTNLVFHACSAPFHARVHVCFFLCFFFRFFFFFMQTHEAQLGNYVLCSKSAFVRQSHRVLLSDFINLTQVHNFTVSAQYIITFR